MQESSSSVESPRPFANLRSVEWRINLGILPSSASSSIDNLRRVTADSRRRYAALRRRLLIDPNLRKDGSKSPDLSIDNPLSQNPDSTWGRFFRNAELEKTVDQDLSRLYPEHGSYFQASGCQGLLRRILLMWCLRHPEYGYRQGMHELLAPLLFVLHVDVERLSEVRKQYEDHFADKFDGLSFQECDATYNFDFKRLLDSMEDEIGSVSKLKNAKTPDELDPEIQTILLLSDPYGAEGELGTVLSEKFMEHDAYSMFDALLSGAQGSVAMAEFFSHSPTSGSLTGLPPVIETSVALYQLLSAADASLLDHLVELGVEPQYFALRWLRVLFGREFSLENLLTIWDEIFLANNSRLNNDVEDDSTSSFRILDSARGALIAGMAVSMILYLRSSLLATENATLCLQRLLHFPETMDLGKIIEKAKSLQAIALEPDFSSLHPSINASFYLSSPVKPVAVRGRSASYDFGSPKKSLNVLPDSWEEKWRVMNEAEELRQDDVVKDTPTWTRNWSEKVRLSLSRTGSDLSRVKTENGTKEPKSWVGKNILEDLSRRFLAKENAGNIASHKMVSPNDDQVDVNSSQTEEQKDHEESGSTAEANCSIGNAGSGENSPKFTGPPSHIGNENYRESESKESIVASNILLDKIEDQQRLSVDSPLPISDPPNYDSPKPPYNEEKSMTLTEKNLLSGKFQWFWKFGRNASNGWNTSEKGGNLLEAAESTNVVKNKSLLSASCIAQAPSSSGEGDMDQNVTNTLRNLGRSILEQIQVLESVFQEDGDQGDLVDDDSKIVSAGKRQVTAMAALNELKRISSLLSKM